MADVTVQVAGRSYALACRDGDEARVLELAADIAARADNLTRALGAMSEGRLLLMSALMIADELHDVRAGQAPPAMGRHHDRLAMLADRAEALAERLAASDG